MSTPGAGHEFPTHKVSWNSRDVLLFNYSIGCIEQERHFLYELHPSFQVFPTYSIILPFKRTDQSVIDFYARQGQMKIPGVPELDPRRVIDGQRAMTFYKPLPTSSEGGNFEVRTKVIGVYDKGKPGTVVETEQRIVNADTGETYTRAVGSAFYTGSGGWGGPKGEKAQSFAPPKDKKPDAVVENQTTRETPFLYRLNGDYNPLHADPAPGKKMGFGGIIMHGLYSWNLAAHNILKELGGSDQANLKEYQARFSAPVIPGDKLITEMWKTGEIKDGFEEVRFSVRVEGGKTVLNNGRALVKIAPKAKL